MLKSNPDDLATPPPFERSIFLTSMPTTWVRSSGRFDERTVKHHVRCDERPWCGATDYVANPCKHVARQELVKRVVLSASLVAQLERDRMPLLVEKASAQS